MQSHNKQERNRKINKLDHTVPIYSPRTTYKNIRQNDENLLADLTLNFDPFTINVLKNEFFIRKWQMNLTEFILVVKEHLLSWQMDIPNREEKLIRCLVNLFNEIDLNGNGILEWEEFQNYVIEKATVLNNIKSKTDEIKNYTKAFIKPMDSSGQVKKFNFPITKIRYISTMDRLAFYEEQSNEIFFMNPESGQLNVKTLKVKAEPIKLTNTTVENKKMDNDKKNQFIDLKISVLDILYIPDRKYQVLLTSTNDKHIRGWKNTTNGWVIANQPDNDEEFIKHPFNDNIYCMAWDSLNEILYCGQDTGQINIWNFKTDTETSLECREKDGHQDIITDMIAMPKLQFLASSSLDSKLILWDTINNKRKRTYIEHDRGIVSLAFNESLILLFSAGLDHEICVWNPYIDNLIFKISGHNSPLLCVQVIEGTSQVVSMDQDGNVRVTDIKKFNVVQQFSVAESQDEKHNFEPQTFCFIPKPLKLGFAGRTVEIYDYDKNYNPLYVDDFVAIRCYFVPSQLAFFTPAGKNVKLWNALTGDIKKIFSDLTPTEITCFSLDKLKKRMLIGDSQGQTGIYNITNGAKIKMLPKHQGEITQIVHGCVFKGRDDFKTESEPEYFFLTAGMDNRINMTKDNEFGENELIRTIEIQKDVLMCSMIFHEPNKNIIIGTNNGVLQFFESETGKKSFSFSEKSNIIEITNIIQIPEINVFLITTDSSGRINFIALPPLMFKDTKVYSFLNLDTNGLKGDGSISAEVGLPITDSVYCSKNQFIFISDDKGNLKCFDISSIIMILKEISDKITKNTKTFITPPKFDESVQVKEVWSIRAHFEMIKSIEYVPDEDIILTSAFDKKVKIWNAKNGIQTDSFQQNYDKKDPKSIAYKRQGTEEIYDPLFTQRIDLVAVNKRIQWQQKKEQRRQNLFKNGFIQDEEDDNDNELDDGPMEIQNFNQYKPPQEEFDPYYFLQKVDRNLLKSEKSNPEWKLEINFMKYYHEFEDSIKLEIQRVEELEEQIRIKNEQDGFANQRFKVVQYQNQDDVAQKFESDHKPVISENLGLDEKDKNFNQNLNQKVKQLQNDKSRKKFKSSLSMTGQSIVSGGPKAQIWEQLHRKELKGKLMFRQSSQIHLTQDECDAAYRLAAALTNHDPEDYRSLKFLEVKPKKDPKKSGSVSSHLKN